MSLTGEDQLCLENSDNEVTCGKEVISDDKEEEVTSDDEDEEEEEEVTSDDEEEELISDEEEVTSDNSLEGRSDYKYAYVDQSLICCHCREIVTDPLQTEKGQRICRVCWFVIREMKSECPCCSVIPNCKFISDRGAARDLKLRKYQCTNFERGCKETIAPMDYNEHLFSCPHRPIACAKGCKMVFGAGMAKEHYEKYCSMVHLRCKSCRGTFLRKHGNSHKESSCPFRILSCSEVGCSKKYRKKDEVEHFTYHCGKKCKCPVCKCEVEKETGQKGDSAAATSSVLLNHFRSKGHFEKLSVANRLISNVVKANSKLAVAMENAVQTEMLKMDIFMTTSTKVLKELSSVEEERSRKSARVDMLLDKMSKLKRNREACNYPVGTMISCVRDVEKRHRSCSENKTFMFTKHMLSKEGAYKLTFNLYVNGYGDYVGKTISVGVMCVQGDHDAIMEWPMNGTVLIDIVGKGGVLMNSVDLEFGPGLNELKRPPENKAIVYTFKHVNLDELYGKIDRKSGKRSYVSPYLVDGDMYFKFTWLENDIK